ncbi:hypothetical protein [Streptomyces sp. NPDC053079]|uniref:hypothetical protein n=1 Tax=Streptomyces sp. NPDC053079 TaxID=3365697 RepID=UPI0037CDC1B5
MNSSDLAGHANIITSRGPLATQTQFHLHAHDGWTTVAVATYRDDKSVHLHGENHLRQVALVYDTPGEALTEFERLYGDAVRPGPARATDTELQATKALATTITGAPPHPRRRPSQPG